MDSVFDYAEACLHCADINNQLTLTHQASRLMTEGSLTFETGLPVRPIADVVFPDRPILMLPRAMPQRKLTTPEGVAAFFHAIAHVEFIAIYLAWDILYRFRGLPLAFYQDWLKVADEEARHFALIRNRMRTLGIDYGDLPAHGGLWEHATDTADDLLARLALVPRCMEARGLDVTPALIEKFKDLEDASSVAVLTRILTDEVGHVEIGSRWFKYACGRQGLNFEDHYRELVTRYFKGGKPRGPFNRELRIIAGFSNAELDWLEQSP